MKKILSITLSLILIVLGTVFAAPESFATPDGADIPVIHIMGTGQDIYRIDENGNEQKVFPIEIPGEYIEEKAEVILPVFAKAFFTQQWDEFCDVLYECVSPILSGFALEPDGTTGGKSYIKWGWTRESLRDNKNQNGQYGATSYFFTHDWRLSPYDIADTLHRYIEDVKYVTGADKVALYGRCFGSNIIAAYMEKYDGEHVSDVIHYCSAAYGAVQISKLFTGEMFIHPDGVERYAYDMSLEVETYVMDLIRACVTLMNKTYGLDIVSWAVENVMKDIYLDIFPRILIESYGSTPGYWSMVNVDDFDKAMETVFYGADLEKYAGLIEKIEDYRNNVQLPFAENVQKQIDAGIEVSNIVKYGLQSVPLTKSSDELADGTVTVYESSFGAVASLASETLSKSYIENAIASGNGKYISPDKQIDASTCLMPDRTWFIKDLGHKVFPSCVNGLVSDIINNEGFTVNDNPEYPQYLVCDVEANTLTPMTEENMNTTERWETDYFKALSTFFTNLIQLIKNLIGSAE